MVLNASMAWLPLAILFCVSVTNVFGKRDEFIEQRVFDPIYERGRTKTDQRSLPFRRVTQLYSRNSREHIRILQSRKVDAMGKDGDKYAKLIIESDNFGRVRIRGAATNYYMCIDKRRRLRARIRGRKKANCIFQEHFADNAFTEFTSVKYKKQYVAFNKRGLQRAGNKTKSGMKSVQFIERPLRVRLYRGKYRGKKNRKNRRQKNLRQKNTRRKVCITIKSWKKWKEWLEMRRQQRKARRARRRKSTVSPTVNPTGSRVTTPITSRNKL